MKKLIAILAAVVAVVVLSGFVVGDVRTAEYKGSAMCKMCHKLTSKEIVEAYEKTGHAKAFQKPGDEGAIVADFESNPVFKKEQVAYVMAKGRNEQGFLDAEFKLLPAKWDSKTKKWKPKEAVDGSTQCVGCHVTGFNAEKKTYVQAGVGCEACHGPGSEHLSAANKDTIVNPKNLAQANRDMVCGQCHSAGKDKTGKFAHTINFRPGDDLTKGFVDAKPTAPGSNQQYSEHITSLHAKNNVGCTVCHDPHGVKGIKSMLRKPVNEMCMDCHAATVKDMATHAPTAAPDATCATCHMPNGQHTFGKAIK